MKPEKGYYASTIKACIGVVIAMSLFIWALNQNYYDYKHELEKKLKNYQCVYYDHDLKCTRYIRKTNAQTKTIFNTTQSVKKATNHT